MKIQWNCCTKNLEKRLTLENVLPQQFNYKITSYNLLKSAALISESKFEATIRVNICNENGVQEFIDEFSAITNTTFNIGNNSDVKNSKTMVLSGLRKCHHNVQKRYQKPDKTVGKNAQCCAKLKFKLLRTSDHDHNDDCQHYPLEFSISYDHNHAVYAASAFKYHPVSHSTKDKFYDLFQAGHAPGSAFNTYRENLKKELGDDYVKFSADRSISPDYRWVFHAFSTYIESNFGKINSPTAFKLAEDRVKKFNETNKAELAHIYQNSDGEYYVTVCDPFSQRCHEMLPASGDIVFLDSTSSLDRQDSRFFRFLTCSPCGGLPLGYIITSNEREELLTTAFTKFRDSLPQYAFFKRGKDLGPHCFMTDDCDAEINSLR